MLHDDPKHKVHSVAADHLPLLGAHVSSSGGWSRVPQRALQMGAEVVQTFSSNPRVWPTSPPDYESLGKLAVALGRSCLPLFMHSIYLINPASPDEGLRERSAQALSHALVAAAFARAIGVVTHLGSHRGEGFERSIPWILDTLRAARSQAERETTALASKASRQDVTIKPPPLLLETGAGSGSTVGGTLDELQILLTSLSRAGEDSLPAFGLCMDTAHMYAAGYALHRSEGLEGVITELERLDLLSLVMLVHLNDSASDFSSRRDRHANPGEGRLGNEGMSGVIRHRRLAHIPFVMEVPGSDGRGPGRHELDVVKTMRAACPPQ